ncbi:hypothetical protein XENOCAPTIV_017283, partial [Xenoophorus captivus]
MHSSRKGTCLQIDIEHCYVWHRFNEIQIIRRDRCLSGSGSFVFVLLLPATNFAWSIEGTDAPGCEWTGVNRLLIADWGYLSLKLPALHRLSVNLQ